MLLCCCVPLYWLAQWNTGYSNYMLAE
uniref:Uncharacterized protein n=1 Tax=Arundo donax TaxID=35708 RepID=A0A0A8ZKB1_ARUDO